VALEEHHIAAVRVVLPPEEMIEPDLVEIGGRGVGRNVSADPALVAVGADDHGHGVPAKDALHPSLDFPVTGKSWLDVAGDGVQVRRVGGIRKRYAELGGSALELPEEPAHPLRPPRLDDEVQGLQPFLGFLAFGVGIGRLLAFQVRNCHVFESSERAVTGRHFYIPRVESTKSTPSLGGGPSPPGVRFPSGKSFNQSNG